MKLHTILVTTFIFFCVSSSLYAKNIDIHNKVWMVSSMVTGNVLWAEKFLEIERLAKNQNWSEASQLAKKFRNDSECEKYYLLNGEPYTIVLDGLNVEYRLRSGMRDETALRITQKFIDDYALSAKGRNFYAFKYIQQKFRSKCQKDNKAYFNACCAVINYDPYDTAQIQLMLSWIKNHPEYKKRARHFFDVLRSEGFYFSPETELVIIDSLSNSNEARFISILNWLKLNAHTDQDVICKDLDLLIKTLPENDIDAFNKAYDGLISLSLVQGTNEERLKTIAESIRLRQIIEEKAYRIGKDLAKKFKAKDIHDLNKSLDKFIDGKDELSSLKENISYLWSAENRQRTAGKLSVSKMVCALDKTEELKLRLQDRKDPLEDINKYDDILLIPGASGQLYHFAEKLYWSGQYNKCFNILSNFFTNPINPDGFTKGAAHFYIGRMFKQLTPRKLKITREKALENALDHLIIVHTFPTCLTYISYSYIMAAEVLAEMKVPEQAIALCMVDVPSLDYSLVKQWRHRNAARYCLDLHDITNSIRHVQEMIRYSDGKDDEDLAFFRLRFDFNSKLWNNLATNFFTLYDKNESIRLALSKDSYLRNDLLQSSLMHTWPRMEDIPLAISTNRVLNNNINLATNSIYQEANSE